MTDLRLEYIDVDQLAENPRNWRTHDDAQLDALKGAISEVGWSGALLYNERTERLIDGHARKKISKGLVPVLIGDWSEEDEKKILATLDPLGALAEANKDALGKLLHDLETDSDALQEMLDGLAAENGTDHTEAVGLTDLVAISIQPSPAMTWVLIGLPTVRFGDIAETISKLAKVDGLYLESTVASDASKD